jgi:hypothetical protein
MVVHMVTALQKYYNLKLHLERELLMATYHYKAASY